MVDRVTLVAVWVSCLAAFAPRAEAQLVRAAERADVVAISVPRDRARPWEGGHIERAVGGAPFTRVASYAGAIDFAVQDDGSVLVLETSTQSSEISLLRAGLTGPPASLSTPQVPTDAHLVARGLEVALVYSSEVLRSHDGGRTWDAPIALVSRASGDEVVGEPWLDGYGMFAASFRVTEAGVLDVVSPTFNTCGSSDRLEAVTHVRVSASGHATRRHISLPSGVSSAAAFFVGAHGLMHGVMAAPGGCYFASFTADAATAHGRPAPSCLGFHAGSNARYTVAVLGEQVVRVRDSGVVRLADLPPARGLVTSITPDERGRALVLDSNGSLFRVDSSGVTTLRAGDAP